ncbi:MAG: hypothetical protein KDE46_00605, partial [Caldilineaceae bacterium]|nr:hypothetical protein [Caldilineaceae bacterium]
IRLALRGSDVNSHDNVEVKLRADDNLYAVVLKSMTDLPVWRPIYLDLQEFTGANTIDLTNITHFEIGIVRCTSDCEVPDVPGTSVSNDQHVGTLLIDEFALVDLKPGAPHRIVETGFERVMQNRGVAELAATSIYTKITPSGSAKDLVPAWFPEQNPNYNTYVQAEALLVFIYEYERTDNIIYRDAARNLARKLLSLQIPTGKTNAGAWYTSYDKNLEPPSQPLPNLAPDPQPLCDGNEIMIQHQEQLVANNIDACEWVGNVGWVLIALEKLHRNGLYDDPAALRDAIDKGVEWVIGQIGREPAYPDLISLGIEGNLSAYFGLLASGEKQAAERVGQAIFQFGWDPVQRRMRPGVRPADAATAMDVSGSWGTTFLCSIGMIEEALDSQGYTATVLRTRSFSETVTGYGDIAGPFTVAIEFTAQAAVAGIQDADSVMNEIYPLQMTDHQYAGAFPGATDHWYGGSLPPWNTTMSGVSPTAWVYFASSYIDPLGGACQSKIHLPLLFR